MMTRPATAIDRDILAACRRIAELGMVSEMGQQPPDIDELSRAHEGLGAVLRERRAAGRNEQEAIGCTK